MTVDKICNEKAITLRPDGWLDAVSSPVLGEAVDGIEEASAIVFDFERVEYISSAGVRQIVAASKKALELGAGFSVINVGREVRNILALTGIDRKISIIPKADQ